MSALVVAVLCGALVSMRVVVVNWGTDAARGLRRRGVLHLLDIDIDIYIARHLLCRRCEGPWSLIRATQQRISAACGHLVVRISDGRRRGSAGRSLHQRINATALGPLKVRLLLAVDASKDVRKGRPFFLKAKRYLRRRRSSRMDDGVAVQGDRCISASMQLRLRR
ncbi:hypothetical protein [Xanthomonas campestris]|uniref:hypothetical protein n=1 Tax=Xanthomonas campestris TaxID=339 RepID=UPI002B2219A5|nr:hypothetical protein [Xanthomonas campestris]MEA9560978.1 hypothetical protein [Xanthomonas campestris]MEA9723863.1 hypothetical protein [Xanthomonas campestris]MEA9808780.1 hypothetical protein [Xanthomonas campestris pv. raphani]MEB1885769.1 hypothetical protein [Xanthomonas campestris pv. campestris]